MTKPLIIAAGCFALAIAAPERPSKFFYVDLQPKANQKLTDNFGSGREGNNLVSLPKGEVAFEDVKFKIGDGLIQLGSALLKEEKPNKVEDIKVGRKLRKLHVLHSRWQRRAFAA